MSVLSELTWRHGSDEGRAGAPSSPSQKLTSWEYRGAASGLVKLLSPRVRGRQVRPAWFRASLEARCPLLDKRTVGVSSPSAAMNK